MFIEMNKRKIKIPLNKEEFKNLEDLVDKLVKQLNPNTTDNTKEFKNLLLSTIFFKFSNIPAAEVKTLSNIINEIRDAIMMFFRHQDCAKITIFGSARTKEHHELYKLAEKFAKLAAKKGFMVITGAGPGIMHAGNSGAGAKNSFGLGLQLPFENSNPIFDKSPENLTNFKYFFTRKWTFFKESDAVVAFPGGYGTMDELFECLTLIQTGKLKIVPVLLVEEEGGHFWRDWENNIINNFVKPGYISHYDMALHRIFTSTEQAIEYISNFYKIFHSYTKTENEVILEVKKLLSKKEIEEINDLYFRLKWHTKLKFIEESTKNQLKTYVYSMAFSSRDYSKLKALIDLVNTF